MRYGETADFDREVTEPGPRTIHEIRLEGLKPQMAYFYRVFPSNDKRTKPSEVYTFQTANEKKTPYAFVILSDTQSNPKVAHQVASHAWAQRPNFMLHIGDQVGAGSRKSDWVEQFFPSLHPLISRVAFFPVLGNHEQNAQHYYNYMALPDPEYYYHFQYGNAEFFMIDSNKKLHPGSEQYEWLEKSLAASKATWKFVCHHHPPYSSDENDYGISGQVSPHTETSRPVNWPSCTTSMTWISSGTGTFIPTNAPGRSIRTRLMESKERST